MQNNKKVLNIFRIKYNNQVKKNLKIIGKNRQKESANTANMGTDPI